MIQIKTKLYLCFEVGGTNNKSSYPTRKETADQFTKTNESEKIAISFPGFIDSSTVYATIAGAIDVSDGTNIITLLNQQITLPIIIENDANCATRAEKHSRSAINCNDFICMMI